MIESNNISANGANQFMHCAFYIRDRNGIKGLRTQPFQFSVKNFRACLAAAAFMRVFACPEPVAQSKQQFSFFLSL